MVVIKTQIRQDYFRNPKSSFFIYDSVHFDSKYRYSYFHYDTGNSQAQITNWKSLREKFNRAKSVV